MKILVSPVREACLSAVIWTVGGILILVVLLATGSSQETALRFLYCAAGWMVLMGVVVVGPTVHNAVRDPHDPPTLERERGIDTARRLALIDLPLVGGSAALVAALGAPWLAGFGLGNGVLLLVSALFWRRWEMRHERQLLHEPRQLWSRNERFFAIRPATSSGSS